MGYRLCMGFGVSESMVVEVVRPGRMWRGDWRGEVGGGKDVGSEARDFGGG